MVCLGNYTYNDAHNGDCIKRLVELCHKKNITVVGIKAIPATDTTKFGVVYGECVDDNILHITKIVEKQTTEFARENLMIEYKENYVYSCYSGLEF